MPQTIRRSSCRGKLARLCVAVLSLPLLAAAQKPLHVTHRYVLGGEGSWDYMTFDAATKRLYIAHQTRVDVVAAGSGAPLGAVRGLTRCHGIVLSPDGKTGFVTDGGAGDVAVFDPATFQILARIPAGKNPDGLAYEPSTGTLWAFNNAGGDVTVIDGSARKVIATVALPGKPEFPVADGQGTVFVNIEDKNLIARLDARTHKLVTTWPLTGCDSPSGLAYDAAGQRLFSVCDNHVMAISDARAGKAVGTAPIGEGPDAAAYDATRQLAFSSNGEGTLTVLDAGSTRLVPVSSVPTLKGARTMALDSATGNIYTVTAQLGPVPAPTADKPHPRPSALPGTFTLLVISSE